MDFVLAAYPSPYRPLSRFLPCSLFLSLFLASCYPQFTGFVLSYANPVPAPAPYLSQRPKTDIEHLI